MRARRILVALDGSAESRAALLAAAKLGMATQPGAELLRLAGLPFAVEVGLSAAMRRPMDPADVERRFRSAAEKSREALREVAAASALPSSFRVARGKVVPELLAAAHGADLVAAGKRGGHETPGHRIGGTGRSLIVHLRAPVLVGGVQGRSPGPAVVICAAPDVPEEAVGFAALLARAFGAPEVVAVSGMGASTPPPAKEGPRVRRRGFASISPQNVRALPEIASASAVVLVRSEGATGDQLLVALAEAVTCPVFVIGPHGLTELLSA